MDDWRRLAELADVLQRIDPRAFERAPATAQMPRLEAGLESSPYSPRGTDARARLSVPIGAGELGLSGTYSHEPQAPPQWSTLLQLKGRF